MNETLQCLAHPWRDRITVVSRLGEGGQATVYSCIDRAGRPEAIKVMTDVDAAEKEYCILSRLLHPNVIGVLDMVSAGPATWIRMEHGGCNTLLDTVMAGNLARDCARNAIRQLCDGLAFLHASRIAHRDIKLENIVFTDGVARIVDFGLAHQYAEGEGEWSLSRRCGSFSYAAPEMFRSGSIYSGYAVDVWSFGVVICAVVFGLFPFDRAAVGDRRFEQFVDWQQADVSAVGMLMTHYGHQPERVAAVVSLLDKMLHVDGRRRPTAETVKQSFELIQAV